MNNVSTMGKGGELALTERDTEILETLARKVRTLSIDQVARTWWSGSKKTARARLRLIERAGLLHAREVLLHPELPLTAPVVSWRPTEEAPLFGPIAYRLQSRWTAAAEPQTILVISEQVATRFGGSPAPPLRTDEITHDLHLAAVYLYYRSTEPELARSWLGERVAKRLKMSHAGPQPDAIIRTDSAVRFIEFGGAYSKQRVQTFHDFCALQKVAYELW